MESFNAEAEGTYPSIEARKELLGRAMQAAQDGDIRDALEALYRGYYLDGLFRRLRAKWAKLSDDEVRDAVAQAVTQLLEKTVAGKQILRPLSYLYKVADGFAKRTWYAKRKFVDVKIERIPAEQTEAHELDRDRLSREALAIARSLLPKLGQTNVQTVMEFIFDALERGYEDVSNQEIGEALMLSPDVVRQSKSRGWQRLERVAEQEGYHISFRFLYSESDTNGEDDDERARPFGART